MARHIQPVFKYRYIPNESLLVSFSDQADYRKLGGFHVFNFQEFSAK